MTTPVKDDDWGSATLYAGARQVEPRMFTEADPMASIVVDDWSEPGAARWGDTTLVGRPRRAAERRRRQGSEGHSGDGADGAGVDLIGDVPASADSDATTSLGTHSDTDSDTDTGGGAERSNRGLLAASGSMAVASLASRVTGFIRSILLLAALGTAAVGTAYSSGNNLPNMVYELLLGGVLSSVLIPLLVHAQSQDDDDGVAYTQRLLSIATAALGALTLLTVLAAPLIAAAFVPAGSRRDLTSIFATLLLPEIFFYGLGAMFIAVLNIRHVYKPGAWSPVLNNVIMIVTIGVFWALPGPIALSPRSITTPQIVVVGVGTTLGIAAQALVLIPSLRRSGFHWQWRFRARPNEVGRMKQVGSLAGWVLAYVVFSQIGVTVIQYVGNRNGGFTIFTNVDLLFQMPYGILVVSLLTAIMPRMSRAAVAGDNASVVSDLSLAARLSAVALIPVTAGLIVLAPVMTVVLFAHGETTIANAHLMGSALAWSAFGLFPFAVVMLQLRVFYAMRDGRTPTLINAFMVVTKVALVLATNAAYAAPAATNVNKHPSIRAVEWLNIATSVSYVIGAIVGHFVLTRRLGHLGLRPVARTAAQIGAASVIGGAAAYAAVRTCTHLLGEAHLGSAAGLVTGGLLGLLVMAAVAWRMRIPDVQQVIGSLRRR